MAASQQSINMLHSVILLMLMAVVMAPFANAQAAPSVALFGIAPTEGNTIGGVQV